MQSDYNEKLTYKFTPCKAPESCLDYEDYDPCESSDDITEKDLAVLLKEEKLKLQAERENATGLTEAGKSVKEGKGAREGKDVNAAQEDSLSKDKKALDKAEDKWIDEDEEQTGKKRVCKKFIKNPFFSNRLRFSSNLPPPPPTPPPQFFPPVEETTSRDRINCLKRRKKCRKSDRKDGRKDGTEDGGESDGGKDGSHGGEDDGKGRSDGDDTDGEDGRGKADADGDDDGDLTGGKRGGRDHDDGSSDDDGKKKRKRCVKPSDRPPCRKKESEIAISLQPRQIPAAQKDLPPTSPKDVSQMERYMKIPCKKVCKKKTDVK